MDHPIKRDHSRFRKIVKGRIRKGLRKYISQGQMIVPKGNGQFKIPMPQIETPKFRFGEQDQGGVGQGEGESGSPVEPGEAGEGQGQGEAGENEGSKELEVELSLEELASILGEELELPKIEPKGKKAIESKKDRYTSIGNVGPDSLKHLKRTYKNSLKRLISSGDYQADGSFPVVPIRSDYRYRAAQSRVEHENAAVVIYMMDVSGSMGDEQKEIVRTESFWINLWLKAQYKEIEIRYIIHDATAKEVDEQTFFRTRESGGTLISSAYHLCRNIIENDYNPSEWNIYPFHFSDGDNWSADDTKVCLELLDQHIVPASNMFCYGQVESRYGSGQFFKDLLSRYGSEPKDVILSKIKDKEGILDSIKEFLGKGK